MRRPTQHAALQQRAAWSHPYTGIEALAVFYNSGGPNPDPANPPVPPAGGNPDPTPKPSPPPVTTTVTMSQDDLNALAAKEKDQGKRAGARQALEDFATEHGFTNVDDAKAFIAAARQAQQDALTEEQKRQADLDRREAEVAAREQAASKAQRDADRRSALAGLGATGDDLADALALLQNSLTDDSDAKALEDAAAALKTRRPELFGTPHTPATPLPPAPGGAPAGTPPPRQAPNGKPGDRGRAIAQARGHRRAAA
ncbi:hypothetical protein ACFY8X_38660 [Streptomyces tanashiensis]|uniref:hypothetical protein n=1 Tax=Streptomyces tanashiensis TaxID=67367 RepID=UPI0036E9ED1C